VALEKVSAKCLPCKEETRHGTNRALTSQQVEAVGVEQLEAKQREDHLQGEGAAVHKVSVEQLSSAVKACQHSHLKEGLFSASGRRTEYERRAGRARERKTHQHV